MLTHLIKVNLFVLIIFYLILSKGVLNRELTSPEEREKLMSKILSLLFGVV